jgi:hypothetical protein
MRLCVNCRHCHAHGFSSTVSNFSYRCAHLEYLSPVTGSMMQCKDLRGPLSPCGPDGRGYEEVIAPPPAPRPVPWWKRV